MRGGEFVACCIGVIDIPNRRCEASAGGYYPPLHYDLERDLVEEPNLGNMPLGLKAGLEYNSLGLELGGGDLLLFHSDGVVETQDSRQSHYGEDRLRELLLQAGREGIEAEELIDRLFRDVDRFRAGAAQEDDITAIAVRVKG